MFQYDWSAFNTKLGLIFMVGVLIVFGLLGRVDFDMMAAGVSALLAWLTIILIPDRRRSEHIRGLFAYLAGGVVLTWLADMMLPHDWLRLFSMAIVTFAGYMLLLRGPHAFMVGWCLVYWYLLAPLFIGDGEPSPIYLAHVAGVGVVIGLNLMKPVWSSAVRESSEEGEASDPGDAERPPVGLVVRYAMVVSLTIFSGLAAGMRWISTDPTLIANATLNMISPSLKQTWVAAVERLVLGTGGIVGGFYFGWFFPEPLAGYVVVAVCSFLCLAVVYINIALAVGVLFFMISYPWGTLQSEAGHLIANEKLISELAGVVLAVIAIAILARIQRQPASGNADTDQA